MDNKEKVLAAIKEAGMPVNVSKIVELTGMEKKDEKKSNENIERKRCDCISETLLLGSCSIKMWGEKQRGIVLV